MTPKSITGILYCHDFANSGIELAKNGERTNTIKYEHIDTVYLIDRRRIFPFQKFINLAYSAKIKDTIQLVLTDKGREEFNTENHSISVTLEGIHVIRFLIHVRHEGNIIVNINVDHWVNHEIIHR